MAAWIKQTGRPGATYNLIDPITKKVVATATADAKGLVNIASVPPSQLQEQLVFTHPGNTAPTTITDPQPIDFGRQQATSTALHVQSPDGHIWQINVSNVGALTATSIA